MNELITRRPVVIIPDYIRSATEAYLHRESTNKWSEAVAYWAGSKSVTEHVVTTLLLPKAQTSWGSFEVSRTANAEVVSVLSKSKLKLIAQVHTHPGEWVEHSQGDEVGATMAHENFLSIVVPTYGVGGMRALTECGVHRFENGAFRQLGPEEVAATMWWIPSVKTC
jgi:hypothetical protein